MSAKTQEYSVLIVLSILNIISTHFMSLMSTVTIFEVHLKVMKELLCCLCSTVQVNNLLEVQALRRLQPHANILQLFEVML